MQLKGQDQSAEQCEPSLKATEQNTVVDDKNSFSKAVGFLAGGMGACGAVTFTNPFEVVKTRLQLQGELQSRASNFVRPYKNLPQAFMLIARAEGPLGLQRGLTAAYGYQLIMNGTRFGGYNLLKSTLPQDSILSSVAAASMSGALGAAIGSPLFLVKTRLQSKVGGGLPAIGTQYPYNGAFHGLSQIYQQDGLKGLFRGVPAASLRTAIGSGVQLPTYDLAKKALLKTGKFDDGLYLHLTSSLCSGFLVCCAMNPLDVVTTRMYSQPLDPVTKLPTKYTSIYSCLHATVSKEGIRGLFKGFTAHYFRIGPHTILTFVFMEKIKAMLA